MKKIFLMFFLMFLLSTAAYAKQSHTKLLAVKEVEGGYVGTTADLYLETKPGKGSIYIETYPFTKLDTQMSTRFANEIACDYLDYDCKNYDFFYTISSDSAIVGGASAGAAMTILTISHLSGWDLNENVSITGTINSGGVIGPIGGIKDKIKAAADIGIKKVLIPTGQSIKEEDDGSRLDLVQLGKEYNIQVTEVADIEGAIYEFTGIQEGNHNENITVDESYTETMKYLAEVLCNRSASLREGASENLKDKLLISIKEEAENATSNADRAFSEEQYYSAASFCFGANTRYRFIIYSSKNMDKNQILEEVSLLKDKIKAFNSEIDKKNIRTISDLEAYMVVKERLVDASDHLKLGLENINDTKTSIDHLSYAMERFYSAESWSRFFDSKGRVFDLSENAIKSSCLSKIAEAQERLQYVNLYLPGYLESANLEIERAQKEMEDGNYELCLFTASKAKAQINTIISTFGVEEEKLGEYIALKIKSAEKNILKQQEKGVFPILGYSYYEYAKSLKDKDLYSSLFFAEYALELTNLDLYFKPNSSKLRIYFDEKIVIFIAGIALGLIIYHTIRSLKPKKKAPKDPFLRKKR